MTEFDQSNPYRDVCDYEWANWEANYFLNGAEDCEIVANLAVDAQVDPEVAACFAEDAGMLVNDGWVTPRRRIFDHTLTADSEKQIFRCCDAESLLVCDKCAPYFP